LKGKRSSIALIIVIRQPLEGVALSANAEIVSQKKLLPLKQINVLYMYMVDTYG